MKRYQVLILAGGMGTRLRPMTETIPKVLIKVAGRPFIFWQMDLLAARGVSEVILCVGFLGEQVEEVVGSAYRDISIQYSYEKPDKLLGTAGAIKNAEVLLDSAFGVLYGDSYLQIDYTDVFEAHRMSGLPATMTVWRNEDRFDISNVALSDDGKRIARYEKTRKPHVFHYIDYGFSVFTKDIICSRLSPGTPAALDQLQRDLSRENLLGAHEVYRRFYEIGSKSGLEDLERCLQQNTKRKGNSYDHQPNSG